MHAPPDPERTAVPAADASRRADAWAAELEALLDVVPVATAVFDAGLRCRRANDRFARLAGRAPDDCAGRSLASLLPGLADEAGAAARRALQTGEAVRVALPATVALDAEEAQDATDDGGGPSPGGRIHLRPVRDAHGRAGGVALAIEASGALARARAGRAEAERERRTLRAVLDALPVAVIIADERGRIVSDNAANRALWGVPPETASWEAYGEWVGWFPDTGRRILAHEWGMARALLHGEVVRDQLVECLPFDGGPRRRYLNHAAPVRDESGRIVGAVAVQVDVTERERVERELERSRGRAARTFQASADALAICDARDGRIIEVNDSFVERARTPREDVIGRLSTDCGFYEDPTERARVHAMLLRDGRVRDVEMRFRPRGAADCLTMQMSIDPLGDDGEGRPMILVALRDVTERARLLEAERAAREQLESVLSAISDGFFTIDRDWRFTHVNLRAQRMLGRPADELLGRRVFDVFASGRGSRFEIEYGHAMQTGEPVAFEAWSETLRRWIDVRAYPVRQGLAVYAQDVTERRETLERLIAGEASLKQTKLRLDVAIAAARLAVWDWDRDTRRMRWDARMFEMLGVEGDPAVPVLDTEFSARVHPGDRATLAAALRRGLERGGTVEIEVRVERTDGSERWLLGWAQVQQDAQGRARRMVGVNLDITDRKLAEQALREADRRKDEFLAMLAHELRNPIAPVRTALRIVEREPLSGPAAHALKLAGRGVRQLARLVDDLLEVSRITRGLIELRPEPLVLQTLVREVADGLAHAFDERGQQLEFDLPDAPVAIVADPVRVAQVVENLLSNAGKFTDRGGLIELRVVAVDGGAAIEVRDSGVGIDPADLGRLFTLFSQIDASIERSHGGLGIGLALVRRLVEMHGGRVAATSAGRGQGATFRAWLPARPASGADRSPGAAP